jgi:hypothetical protein
MAERNIMIIVNTAKKSSKRILMVVIGKIITGIGTGCTGTRPAEKIE